MSLFIPIFLTTLFITSLRSMEMTSDTCKSDGNSCRNPNAGEVEALDETNFMQTWLQTRRHGTAAHKNHAYGPFRVMPALFYFQHWAKGTIERDLLEPRDINDHTHGDTDSASLQQRRSSFTAATAKLYSQRVAMNLHRLRTQRCNQLAIDTDPNDCKLHGAQIDSRGVAHFVFQHRNSKALQYVAAKGERILAAYPAVCARSTMFPLLGQNTTVKPKPNEIPEKEEKQGCAKNLDPATDPLVQDCKKLIKRAAEENCGEAPFTVAKVISAKEKVVDGMDIEMGIQVTPTGGGEDQYHIVECLFEVPNLVGDAELLQRWNLSTNPFQAFKTNEIPEEEQGLAATVAMTRDICEAGEVSTATKPDIEAFLLLAKRPMGELSGYKGFEWVNKLAPDISKSLLQQPSNTPASFDFRDEYPTCYPPRGVSDTEVIRDQGACGSCWAFASASAAMSNLCASAAKAADSNSSQALFDAEDRYEVSVQKVISCNSFSCGCEGGFALASDSAWSSKGMTRERDAPYLCGGGSTFNHFTETNQCWESNNWLPKNVVSVGTCLNYLSYPGWNWGGASRVKGESAMLTVFAEGYAMYIAFWVYSNIMSYSSGIYMKTSGSQLGGHAVTGVGYGVQDGIKYWIIQNSWGPNWGVDGYCKFLRGQDLAGIESLGAYYMRAWVSTGKVPKCFDSADTGWEANGAPITCQEAPSYHLCSHEMVRSMCPIACNSCKGGETGWASMPAPGPTPAPTPPGMR